MSANPIPYNGPAPTDTSGVLSEFVRLPTDNSPSESGGNYSYVEKWKGPYNTAKDLLTRVRSGMTISSVHLRLGTGRIQRFDVPSLPTGYDWILTGIQIQELEAGDHAIVTFDYSGIEDQGSGGGTDISKLNVWNLSWQAYQVSPWNFCKNDSYSLESYNWSPSDTEPQADWQTAANRAYIEQALNAPQWEIKGNNGYIVYTPDLNQQECRKYLPLANTEIYKKVALQRNAVYHTPVLTHQTAKKYPQGGITRITGIGAGMDYYSSSLPSGCPYILSGYDWIKTNDDHTESKSENELVITRRETWYGYPTGTIDENYYGNGQFSHDENGIKNGRWPVNGV